MKGLKSWWTEFSDDAVKPENTPTVIASGLVLLLALYLFYKFIQFEYHIYITDMPHTERMLWNWANAALATRVIAGTSGNNILNNISILTMFCGIGYLFYSFFQ